ncbi:MAG: S9 family peptidase [Acidobacteriaceae bacterium]
MAGSRWLPAALLALAATFASAQGNDAAPPQDSRIAAIIGQLGKTRTPVDAAISPDGTFVAWSLANEYGTELHLTGIAPDGAARGGAWNRIISPDTISNIDNLNASKCSSQSPAWSPDGKQLAFLSECTPTGEASHQPQIFVWTLATNQVRAVTRAKGLLRGPAWSPDGKSIAYLYVQNATRVASALAAEKPPSGVIGEDGVEVQRVAVVDVAQAGTWMVTPPKLYVYEFDWAPNSKGLAYIAAPAPGENNWWVAQLYTQPYLFGGAAGSVDTAAATTAHSILDPSKVEGSLRGMQIAVPRWSPDGKQIAFIGGIMSDQGSTGGDIYLMPSTGGDPKDITPGRKVSPAWFTWIDDASLDVAEISGGSSHLFSYDIASGQESSAYNATMPDSVGDGRLEMSVSLSRSGNLALIRSSFEHPPEVWAGPLAHLQQLTHLNDSLKPAWGKSESITWTNEGFKVQGWLLYPADYDPAKQYPMITMVHGGPSSAVVPRWPGVGYGGVPFSALGYFVFMPNPRGSFGQGEAFTRANVKDLGYGDLRDVLAGLDVLEKKFPIDPKREGLTGWSYGGFATMFTVTQTNRFRAAVAGAGISDWQSYYGENSIDQWMIPFFGKSVYDDPAIYARSSAINYIKNAKTPTLVVVGDRDGECPAPQSFEFWHALKAEGVPTQLVVYPDEGHRFVSYNHRRDVLERALAWFDKYMPAGQ